MPKKKITNPGHEVALRHIWESLTNFNDSFLVESNEFPGNAVERHFLFNLINIELKC